MSDDPPNSTVNKITWPQVGRVAEPGRYMFTFGLAHDYGRGSCRLGTIPDCSIRAHQNDDSGSRKGVRGGGISSRHIRVAGNNLA
jgi:hypothetical protein